MPLYQYPQPQTGSGSWVRATSPTMATISMANGTAGAPAIAGAQATTGIYFDGASGDILFSSGGVRAGYFGSSVLNVDGALVVSTTQNLGGATTYTAAAAGPILKRGSNGRVGTFVANGVTPVTVNNTSIAITDTIIISLNTVGGTVGALPAIQTITAATGFTVAATALDTSTYNYSIIKNAA